MAAARSELDPDEAAPLQRLIAEVVQDPAIWMDTPHDLLGGKKPRELLGTDQENLLRDLARSIKIGMSS